MIVEDILFYSLFAYVILSALEFWATYETKNPKIIKRRQKEWNDDIDDMISMSAGFENGDRIKEMLERHKYEFEMKA